MPISQQPTRGGQPSATSQRTEAGLRQRHPRVLLGRRIAVRTSLPLISFTFDDFPIVPWTISPTELRKFLRS